MNFFNKKYIPIAIPAAATTEHTTLTAIITFLLSSSSLLFSLLLIKEISVNLDKYISVLSVIISDVLKENVFIFLWFSL